MILRIRREWWAGFIAGAITWNIAVSFHDKQWAWAAIGMVLVIGAMVAEMNLAAAESRITKYEIRIRKNADQKPLRGVGATEESGSAQDA